MLTIEEKDTSTRPEVTVTPSAPSVIPEPDKAGAGLFSMNGWIKLHRQFMEWEWYTDSNAKAVFIHCLLSANIKDNKWRGTSINRGSYVTSLSKLAADTGLTIKAVRIALNKLKTTGEIATVGASQYTTITICKYESYQSENTQEGQTNGTRKGKRRANEGQTKGMQGATTREGEEGKEEKKGVRTPHVQFYSNQLKASEGQPEHSNYKTFVEFLYGRHPENSEKLERLLAVTKQVKYEEFVKLKKAIWKSNPLTLSDYILSLENYKAKVVLPYQSVYQTILTWIKRDQEPKK